MSPNNAWHLAADVPPPLGPVEIRLHSGTTHFAHWHAGRGVWIAMQGTFAGPEVEAWRRTPRIR